MTFDDSSEFIKEIRVNIADILKQVDDFVNSVENQIKARENELTEMMKKYESLKDKESKLVEDKLALENQRKEVHKQTQANRDMKISLDKKDQELQDKLQRVQSILN
jgi:Skp family chaperone for outer membrane proteins